MSSSQPREPSNRWSRCNGRRRQPLSRCNNAWVALRCKASLHVDAWASLLRARAANECERALPTPGSTELAQAPSSVVAHPWSTRVWNTNAVVKNRRASTRTRRSQRSPSRMLSSAETKSKIAMRDAAASATHVRHVPGQARSRAATTRKRSPTQLGGDRDRGASAETARGAPRSRGDNPMRRIMKRHEQRKQATAIGEVPQEALVATCAGNECGISQAKAENLEYSTGSATSCRASADPRRNAVKGIAIGGGNGRR